MAAQGRIAEAAGPDGHKSVKSPLEGHTGLQVAKTRESSSGQQRKKRRGRLWLRRIYQPAVS